MSMGITAAGLATGLGAAAAADSLYTMNKGGGGSGSGGGSGGGSGKGPTYTPTDMSGADQGWMNAYNTTGSLATQANQGAMPGYQQSYQQQQGINYSPYQQSANMAGQQYQGLSNMAQGQMGQYNQQAGIAGQQQQNLYGAGNQIYQQAFDPNNAQFNQTQQQLSDQVNAGQAMRGLGNSAVGAGEYNNAMQNFDTAWNTQKLQNEQIGLQGMSQASNAGGSQGQLVGADMVGALNAGQQGAGYQQQAGQIPLQAQQMIAGMPAQNAAGYQNNLASLQGMYGNQMSAAIPYMNQGQGAQQWNADYNTAQNASNMNALVQAAPQIGNGLSSAGSWLSNNVFNTPQQQMQSANQSYIDSSNIGGSVPDTTASMLSSIPSYGGY